MKLKIKNTAFVVILSMAAFIITSCEKKEKPQPMPPVISQDSAQALDKQAAAEKIKKLLGDSVKVVEPGKYQGDSLITGVVAGTEISTQKQWGIRFIYFVDRNNKMSKTFETPLLRGSFKDSMVRKIKLADRNYEMIYYDSQDYFLGSGLGEIFSYIIDFNNSKVYSAHFFTAPRKPVSLYLSENIDNPEIRDIFLKHFRRDFPDLRIVSKDYNLDEID